MCNIYTDIYHGCWKPGGGEESQHKVLCGRDTKGAVERQYWQKQHVNLWAESCVGRVVYSLEGKDRKYEFNVHFL